MGYVIANNQGHLYAHDIELRLEAELIMHDIKAKIGEQTAREEEIEIIEDGENNEKTNDSKKGR